MTERAIFLDRDNTIIEDKEGYLGDPAKVKLLPGAAKAIATLHRLGFRIIIASNQSGVARGKFDESAVEAVNQEMCRQLLAEGGPEAKIDASYYCPFHPKATIAAYKLDHEWRKPKPGMLLQAATDFQLDLRQSWMIGDMQRDIACGLAAGCRTILVRDPALADSNAAKGEAEAEKKGDFSDRGQGNPHFVVMSLEQAAEVVVRETTGTTPKTSTRSTELKLRSVGTQMTTERDDQGELKSKLGDIAQSLVAIQNQIGQLPRKMEQPVLVPANDPAFSWLRMLATMAQVVVVACVMLGLWEAVLGWNLPGLGIVPADTSMQITHLLKGGVWLMGAAVLQGFVATYGK